MTDRDTHFASFAQLLWDDLLAELDRQLGMTLLLTPKEQKIVKDIFAQRAYDLIEHACNQLENAEYELRYWPSEQVIDEFIPDLTQWPESPTAE